MHDKRVNANLLAEFANCPLLLLPWIESTVLCRSHIMCSLNQKLPNINYTDHLNTEHGWLGITGLYTIHCVALQFNCKDCIILLTEWVVEAWPLGALSTIKFIWSAFNRNNCNQSEARCHLSARLFLLAYQPGLKVSNIQAFSISS